MSRTLSICIPTYNRCARLQDCCAALLTEIRRLALQPRIELCISDNHSPDATPAAVADIIAANPDIAIHYSRQERNLGFAGNYASVLKMAHHDYVLVTGDDDRLKPDALLHVMEMLRHNHPLVIFNTLPGRGPLSQYVPDDPQQITVLNNAREVIQSLGIFQVSFLGNLLFRRADAVAHLTPAALQSAYPHSVLAFTILQDHSAIYVLQSLFVTDDSLRDWRGQQTLYVSIDMARILTHYAFVKPQPRLFVMSTYWKLLKSLPRAVLGHRLDRIKSDSQNPFQSLRLANVLDCYRHSRPSQLLAWLLWITATLIPAPIARKLPSIQSRFATVTKSA